MVENQQGELNVTIENQNLTKTDLKVIQAASLIFSGNTIAEAAQEIGMSRAYLTGVLAQPQYRKLLAEHYRDMLSETRTLLTDRLPYLVNQALDALEAELNNPLSTNKLATIKTILDLATKLTVFYTEVERNDSTRPQ